MKKKTSISFNNALAVDRKKYPRAKVSFRKNVLGDPAGTAFRKALSPHGTLSVAQHNPIYALPTPLLDVIEQKTRGWLSSAELRFERDLTALCQKHHAAGFVDESPVNGSVLEPAPMPIEPRDILEAAGGSKKMGVETVASSLKVGEERLSPIRDQGQAYLGWLITNPQYLTELAALRRYRTQCSSWRSFEPDPIEQTDVRIQKFLGRWQLTRLNSWELPLAQGPNFTGYPWAPQVMAEKGAISIEVPVTTGIQARYPLRASIEDARWQQNTPHLAEWVDVIQHQSGSHGPIRYQHMFRLHFYRNITLMPRYGDRIKGRTGLLDKAFAHFLHLSLPAIKQLRFAIICRLGTLTKRTGTQTV